MVETVQSKFKRIGSDWIKIKDAIEVQSKKIKMRQELMTKDHEVFSRIICSLVELEYIQQSLDNQDELDKHNTNLYGLNEANMSIEELLQRGGFQQMITRKQN